MLTDEQIAERTRQIFEMERRIIALALATGHPELATPFPDPGYQAAQRARAGIGLLRPFDNAKDFIEDLDRVTKKRRALASRRRKK